MKRIAPPRLFVLGLLAVLPMMAQNAKFELAGVQVSKTAYWFAQNTGGVIREGRYVNRDATMLNLIMAAYGVTEDAIAGGPSWLTSDLYNVIARVPSDTTPAEANLMLKGLLAERFALVIKEETRPMPRYVLSVAPGGSKLKPAPAAADSGCRSQQMAPVAAQPGVFVMPNLKATCHNMTAQQLTTTLRQMAGGYITSLGHEVIDATKLEGAYDFDIEWTPSGTAARGPDAITIFGAVEKLGLKLELQDVPVQALVIQGVNRAPSANPEGAAALAFPPARFEVATIKPVDPGSNQPRVGGLYYQGGSQMRGGGTLRSLIALSHQIQPNASRDMIVGLPKSADSQLWDINAKLPSTGEGSAGNSAGLVNGRPYAPPSGLSLEMLKGLLVDQFELKTHYENREVTVYELVVDGSKSKMTQAAGTERSECKPDPNAPKPFPNIGTMVDCRNITMADFARNLEQATGFFDHPIVDATGLKGGWNFFLGWPANMRAAPRPQDPNQPGASDPTGITSAAEAVEKELGLKLVRQKRSVPVLVVDHVAEKPIE